MRALSGHIQPRTQRPFGISLFGLFQVPGARGLVIVGTHSLVVRRSAEPLGPLRLRSVLAFQRLQNSPGFTTSGLLNVVGGLRRVLAVSRGSQFRPSRINAGDACGHVRSLE